MPGIQTQLLQNKKLGIDPVTYNLFTAVSLYPNVIISLVAGYWITKFGVAKSFILSNVAALLSQFLLYLGIALLENSGISQVAQMISVMALILDWFQLNELTIATGSINAVSSNLTQGLGLMLYPRLYNATQGYTVGFIVLFIMLGIAIVFAIIAYFMDKKYELRQREGSVRSSTLAFENKIQMKDIFTFRYQIWFIVISIACNQACWVSYNNNALVAIQGLFNQDINNPTHITENQAGLCQMLGYYVATLSPILVVIFDKYGYRAIGGGVIGQFVIIISYLVLMYSPQNVSFGIVIFSSILWQVGIAIFQSAFWSTIGLVVPEQKLALAFGLQQSLQNLFNGSALLLYGTITEKTSYRQGQFYPIFFCIMIAFVSLFLALILSIIDNIYYNGRVNLRQRVNTMIINRTSQFFEK